MVHVLVFGVFWLVAHLATINSATGLVGLTVVVADLFLISGVLKGRLWVRSMILILAPPLSIYLAWLLIWGLLTPAVPAGFKPIGDPTAFELIRVLAPAAMLLATCAILVLALARGRIRQNVP